MEDPSTSAGLTPGHTTNYFKKLLERTPILDSFSKGLIRNSLRLFVAVSGMLSVEDHQKLAPLLWNECLDDPDYDVQASVSVLCEGS